MELKQKAAADERDLRYTCFGSRADCAQRLNKVGGVVAFVALCNCFQTMVAQGLPGVVISTIERRFELPSSQSSWIASSFEVAGAPTLLLLAFIGNRLHRPRTIASGMLVVMLGCVLFILPHFLTPVYAPGGIGEKENTLCMDRSNETVCEVDSDGSSADSRWYPLFIVGRVLHGIGSSPVYVLSLVFMDDIMPREKFSMGAGVFNGLGVVGPALGTIGGGLLLGLFTDFRTTKPEDVGLTPSDPRWVGAWWLPFIIGGALCLIFAWPMGGFPRDMPGAAEMRRNRISEAFHSAKKSTKDNTEYEFDKPLNGKEIRQQLKALFTNPAYLLLCLYLCGDNIIVSGFTAFGPKYIEIQFNLESGQAGALFGVVLLPAGIAGTLIGGAIIEKMKLSCHQIMKAQITISAITVLASVALLMSCPSRKFAGITVNYNNLTDISDESQVNLNSSCNIDCMCADLRYDPICSHENIRYYSPCHAGCSNYTEQDNIRSYYNCSCILEPSYPTEPSSASSEICEAQGCSLMPGFLVLFFFAVLFLFVCATFNISSTVRVLGAPEKSMGIAIQWVLLRLLGTIPGPIAFGRVYDDSCVLWTDRCGQRGACLHYDNWSLAIRMFLLCIGVKIAALIFISVCACVYKTPKEEIVLKITDEKMVPMPHQEYTVKNVINGTFSVSQDRTLGCPNKGFETDFHDLNVDRSIDVTKM